MKITVEEIQRALKKSGYYSDTQTDYALYCAFLCEKPLLLCGPPGSGKTSVAKAFADGMGMPFIRVQMYSGVSASDILYDYDYQKQLLTLEAIRPVLERELSGKSLPEAIQAVSSSLDFYGMDFLIRRPVLKALTGEERTVILFDEVDKGDDQEEHMLLEFLESGRELSIPQYGTVRCEEDKKPVIFLTSNGYRELSGALRRRCCHLFLKQRTKQEMVRILMAASGADERLARGVAACLYKLQGKNLRQTPSIAEGIDFARCLSLSAGRSRQVVMNALGFLIKNSRDAEAVRRVVDENGEDLWTLE